MAPSPELGAAPSLGRLRLIWGVATLGAILVAAAVASFALSPGGLDANWLIAGALALGLGLYARLFLIAGLATVFAPGLRAYLGETDVSRQGEGVEVVTERRSSGDPALDGFIDSYAQATEQVVKMLVWALVILTVIGLVYAASLFGLVDFSW
ncbi:MAG: hypothetical protein AAF909_05755 [Pseudomonadota bacterium]